MSLITLKDISFRYGGPALFRDVSFSVEEGDRIGLVGRNGAGKSTLLGLLRGDLAPQSGSLVRQSGVTVADLSQRLPPDTVGSAMGVVAGGFGAWGTAFARYHQLLDELGARPTDAAMAELERLQHQLERDGGFSREPEIERALDRVGVRPDEDWSTLSVGRRRRVLLARAIVSAPDLLILDEPTNHLDIEAIEWLEEFLLKYRGALLFVTHDRAFLGRLASRVLLLERGRVLDYDGGYANFLRRREADAVAEETREADQDKLLAKEEAWMKQGVKARRTRAQARVRALDDLRAERRARPRRVGTATMKAAAGERSGNLVIELTDVSFSYPGGERLIDGLTTEVMRGDKIGLIGPNGAGKTTLLKLLVGELLPTSGRVRHGTKLQVAYFDQLHRELDESKTVAENVTADDHVFVNGVKKHIIGYLQDFLFRPEQIRGSVKNLSGGERNRLLLARLFTRPSNVLLLDEPTNDLDAETVEILEDLLISYDGTLLLVSHDRAFLNEVVTSTMVLEGQGVVGEYAGGYDDWLVQRPGFVRAAPSADREPKAAARARSQGSKGSQGSQGSSSPALPPVAGGPRRRTFGESKEAAALPDKIDQLERERDRIHALMAEPTFYTSDPDRIGAETARLDAVLRDLTAAYARWEQLEELLP